MKEISSTGMRTCTVSGQFFKARPVKGSKVYTSNQMGAVEVGKSHDGRYNHAGQSVLYLAEYAESAAAEIVEDINVPAMVWIQRYELGQINQLLDLAVEWDDLGPATNALLVALSVSGVLEEKVKDRGNTWKPQYFWTAV